jgi:adenylate cyclase class IV
MATAGNLEIEIKIQLGSFTDYLKLLGQLGPIEREEHHLNAFFDSPQRDLSEAGYALRVRATDCGGSVTVKSLVSQNEAVAVRKEVVGEIEASLARSLISGHTDLMSLSNPAIDQVRKDFPELQPMLLLQFRNDRQIKSYRFGDYDLDLEIDKTEFADGSVEYELEIELNDERQHELVENQVRKMFASLVIPFQNQTKSKFERALERL